MCVIAIPIAMAVVAAAGAAMQAKSQSDAANYQAAQAKNNAKIAGYQGQIAQHQGEEEADAIHRQVSATIGAQRAGFAAGGISLGSGTELAVESDTARAGALDLATARNNTDLKKWGFNIEKQNYLSSEAADKSAGTNALISGGVNVASSLLSSASMYSTNSGMFSGIGKGSTK